MRKEDKGTIIAQIAETVRSTAASTLQKQQR